MPPTSSYTLQPAGLRDLPGLRRLEQECFGVDAWPLVDLLAALSFPGLVRIKAVAAQQMIGFVGGDTDHSTKRGWITTLGVTTNWRCHGVGRALLTACEQALPLVDIRLCVRRSNLAAQTLYLNSGYHQVEIWPHYYQGGEDALVLEKVRPGLQNCR
jgi:ribosomal protein S18 acetylase RimI-like enzyme